MNDLLMKVNSVSVDSLNLSLDALLILQEENITNLQQFRNSKTRIKGLKNIDDEIRKELITKINEYKEKYNDFKDNFEVIDSKDIRIIAAYFKEHDISLDEMKISTRVKNVLRKRNIDSFYQITQLDINSNLRNLGKKLKEELQAYYYFLILDQQYDILDYISSYKASKYIINIPAWKNDPDRLSRLEMFLKSHDVTLEDMNLSRRCENYLRERGLDSLSKIILSDYFDDKENRKYYFYNETTLTVKDELNQMKKDLVGYVNGDDCLLYCDEWIENKILEQYHNQNEFKSYSLSYFMSLFNNDLSFYRIACCLNHLIDEKRIIRESNKYYKYHVSFIELINYIDERSAKIMMGRMNGQTFEEMAQEFHLTKERLRQIVIVSFNSIKEILHQYYQDDYYREDKYAYFYQHYKETRTILEYLKEPLTTYYYLTNNYKEGKGEVEDALEDDQVIASIKDGINQYLDYNKIIIKGYRISKNRSSIEDYLIRNCCQSITTYDEFLHLYNHFLSHFKLENEEYLKINDKLAQSRINRINHSHLVLWNRNRRFRFYDIGRRDYSALLDELALQDYHDVIITTSLLFDQHQQIMKDYDIRDCYELHNLLKKIIKPKDYPELTFKKMPTLLFGNMTMENQLTKLYDQYQPYSIHNLVDIAYEKYGFTKNMTMENYFNPEKKKNNRVSEGDALLEESLLKQLKKHLTSDFYTMKDFITIYTTYVGDDLNGINNFNLNCIGYNRYNDCILKEGLRLSQYYNEYLLKEDVVDIVKIRKDLDNTGSLNTCILRAKARYELLEYEPDKCINRRVLEAKGIGYDEIKQFCQEINDLISDGTYFTIRSLKKYQHQSLLYDLPYEDYFYNSLLAMDSHFAYIKFKKEILLCKCSHTITRFTFIEALLKEFKIISMDVLIDYIEKEYNLHFTKKTIAVSLKNQDLFYDLNEQMIYLDYQTYKETKLLDD